MESIVEGEDIDPAELAHPDWATVRRKQQALQAQQTAMQASANRVPTNSPQHQRRRPARRKPPAQPLPENDIKIILRPHGGLALTTVALATLADTIQRHAGLDPCSDDQVRIQSRANFAIVSTPSEERARKYEKVASLTLKGQQYGVSTHVAAPANTVTGVIFNIPEDDTPEQVLNSICQFNPDLRILDAKRLNTSNIAQILFDGTKVPYWIRYRAATYRCKPFRRKSEACPACWQPGHRRDVCPNAQAPPRCPTCGTINAPENHKCVPRCIVCEGPHLTGTVDCPKRYQPRRLPFTYAQAAAMHNAVPTQDAFPPLPGKTHQAPTDVSPRKRNATMGTSQRELPQQEDTERKQVSYPRTPPSSSPQFQIPIHPTLHSAPHPDLLKELRAIRAEITLLRQENAALKRENAALKKQTTASITEPTPQSEPTGAAAHESSSPPPPTKRKAVSNETAPLSPIHVEGRIAAVEDACKQALAEQKQEYIQLHQILLNNQNTIQATIQELRAEMHNCMQQFANVGAPANSAPPSLAFLNGQAQ